MLPIALLPLVQRQYNLLKITQTPINILGLLLQLDIWIRFIYSFRAG